MHWILVKILWCSRAGSVEEDVKLLQRPGLTAQERLAARLRKAEKAILQGTLDAVRRCVYARFSRCFEEYIC